MQSDWRSKARGLYREISESREKEEKRKKKSENSKEIYEALKSDVCFQYITLTSDQRNCTWNPPEKGRWMKG